jgi:radical SAM superfamily enzyme YgiQ (UPF0313 family)
MPEIVLATLNARYIHTAFGLRYLLANLGPLQDRATLTEFEVSQRPLDIAERLLALEPRILGLGVYIWNAVPTAELVGLLKRLRPELTIILGGPEVSHETAEQSLCQAADYTITGEADLTFAQVCQQLLAGERPPQRIIPADLPDLSQLVLPYELYTDDDIAHRLIYVEGSRGCPLKCEFCLSALDVPVRQAPLPALFSHLERLLARGAQHFKFVDRTFNLHPQASQAVLEFLLQRYRPGFFFHFEVVPDHLPGAIREIIRQFPPGALQFEAGVQTFNPEVAARIQRRQDYALLGQNLTYLRQETGVHIHADLIVGLPGESLESLAAGFDRLIALRPQEIQVGMLKRLRGAPIARHDAAWRMVYSPLPPYEILANKLIDFPTMQRLRRFARYWDLLGNSGNFVESGPLLWRPAAPDASSPFGAFLRFSDWLFGQVRRTDSLALLRLIELLHRYLTVELRLEAAVVAEAVTRDYRRGGRREPPAFLAPLPAAAKTGSPAAGARFQRRQTRHLG